MTTLSHEVYMHIAFAPSRVYMHGMDYRTVVNDVVRNCYAVRTLSAARAISRRYDMALKSVGLTATQATLLIAIIYFRPQAISDLAEMLSLERTTLTRNLKLLEKLGYVVRSEEGPARRRAIHVTEAGHDIIEKAYPLWQEAQRETQALLKSQVDHVFPTLDGLRGHRLGQSQA